jgi:TonB family protein
MDWLHRLGRYGLDLDAPLPGGGTNRTAWAAAPIADGDARDIWAYAAGLSASQPVLPSGVQSGNPDLPSPDTGVTRPSETAVARGVEAFDQAFRAGGMAAVIARIDNCWAERRAVSLTRQQVRWSYETCASLDLAASSLQRAAMREMPSLPRLDFLEPYAQDLRLQAFNQFASDGLVPAVHRRAMARSVGEWLGIITFSSPPRASPPSLPGARPPSSGATTPATPADAPPAPSYPETARRNGEMGDVTLLLRVGESGRVLVVDVERSSGFGALDDAARLAGLRWRFRPGQRDGTAVTTFVRAGASFALPPGGAPRTALQQISR